MAFGRFDASRGQPGHERQPVLADINMTPMIDIMLVLLVVFIITAPLLSHSIAMDLPKAQAGASPASTVSPVAVAIDAKGQLFWNGQPMPAAQMDQRFREAAAQQPQPDIALSADQHTAYSQITAVMSAAQRAGLSHFGFVVDSADSAHATQR